MKKLKFKLNQTVIHRFNKRVLGFAAESNVSMFEIALRALALEGRPKPEGVGTKQWIFDNAEFMGVKPKVPKVKAPAAVKAKQPPPAPKKQDKIFEATDSFLVSFEWRRVRMVALKKYGAICQCCGATPKTGAVMNVDHIKPRKVFPELALDVDNLQVLCHECNHGKGNWDMTDWRPHEHAD